MRRFWQRVTVLIIVSLCTAVSAAALGDAETSQTEERSLPPMNWKNVQTGMEIRVTGKVRLVGNVPFSELVITDNEGNDWYINQDSRPALSGHEQEIVTVRAVVHREKIVLANGKRLNDRRVLDDVEIVQ
ncbi:hypothetical protein Spirs_3898 [Sediminispirochaeta smaragdinae DSM 11293]|uniref:Bacterial OB-fold domain-containing protein n=2 Tax=Sediminispirochaeta TaxID=1911556 RepID=E1R914_SEDSS|nr:hypothetical protein Spirs_3898 [Sediminispirochaeta smaragdinae DSM 11293]